MNYTEIEPRAELAPYVKCYWRLQGDGPGAVERIVPDGCSEIVLNRADPFRAVDGDGIQPRLMLVGQIRRFLRIVPTGAVDLLGIRFRPGGLYPILGVPMAELTDLRIRLGDASARLERELEGADLDRIEETLLRMLRPRSGTVTPSIRDILARNGDVSIASLGTSARTLERAFRREVGIPAKLLARITRFQGVIRAVEETARLDWAGLAVDCGYYDQAHLIRDFKAFSGLSPSRYFATEHPMSDFFTGVSDSSNPPA